MMTRAAIPQWQVPNLKALCNNRLTVQVVTESLKTMFGGDSVAHKKDIDRVKNTYHGRSSREEGYWMEDYYDEDDDAYYEDEYDPHEDC